ncbi:MAG TPA: ATP-binding cassette domain-containing protein, partial [Geminicoccaceae bacterium]|nr:ATP-binding cassette domain-containing protein [Geminicoccaceae bacterium]
MAGLEVRGLKVVFETDDGIVEAVRGIDFDVQPGERLGFVGESGSGKTTTALALMGMIDAPGRVAGGTALLGGVDLLRLSPAEHAARRLVDVAYIPQGAMNSLNPVMRVGAQIADGMIDHGTGLGRAARKARVGELLRQVGLEPSVAERFPHELSGGMKQRVAIAISIALRPQLLIADEPTSALDVITQRRVMQTLREVQDAIGAGLILIGHDMGLMAQFADRIMVLRHGRLVEEGQVRQIFREPKDAYTKELIDSVPALEQRRASVIAAFGDANAAPIIELDRAAKTYRRGLFDRTGVPALQPLSFSMAGGTPLVVSIVGQSGSGKSTLGSLLLGFLAPSEGRVLFEGRDLQTLSGAERRESHRRVQAVFQDPYAAYNPFYKVDHNLAEPLRNFGLARDRASVLLKMREACELVGLDPDQTIHRFAHQLSGGQRQRLMVGRELAEVDEDLAASHERAARAGKRDPVLRVSGLRDARLLQDISFELAPGEILGLAGLMGSGRSEVAEAVFGISEAEGEVEIAGEAFSERTPQATKARGVALVSEDRRADQVFAGRSVRENLTSAIIDTLSGAGSYLRPSTQREEAARMAEAYAVRHPGLEAPIGSLSGGNQQKCIIARWLATKPRICILDEPTKGIDVGAKADIHRLVAQLAEQGL